MGDPEELKRQMRELLVSREDITDEEKAESKDAPATPKEFLRYALEQLKAEKPNDRSEKDRHYAVCVTEMEKVCAYYMTWIVMEG